MDTANNTRVSHRWSETKREIYVCDLVTQMMWRSSQAPTVIEFACTQSSSWTVMLSVRGEPPAHTQFAAQWIENNSIYREVKFYWRQHLTRPFSLEFVAIANLKLRGSFRLLSHLMDSKYATAQHYIYIKRERERRQAKIATHFHRSYFVSDFVHFNVLRQYKIEVVRSKWMAYCTICACSVSMETSYYFNIIFYVCGCVAVHKFSFTHAVNFSTEWCGGGSFPPMSTLVTCFHFASGFVLIARIFVI